MAIYYILDYLQNCSWLKIAVAGTGYVGLSLAWVFDWLRKWEIAGTENSI